VPPGGVVSLEAETGSSDESDGAYSAVSTVRDFVGDDDSEDDGTEDDDSEEPPVPGGGSGGEPPPVPSDPVEVCPGGEPSDPGEVCPGHPPEPGGSSGGEPPPEPVEVCPGGESAPEPAEVPPEPGDEVALARDPAERESLARGLYIRRSSELATYGHTALCPGCDAALANTIAVNHTMECRRRILASMEAAGDVDRLRNAERRAAAKRGGKSMVRK